MHDTSPADNLVDLTNGHLFVSLVLQEEDFFFVEVISCCSHKDLQCLSILRSAQNQRKRFDLYNEIDN